MTVKSGPRCTFMYVGVFNYMDQLQLEKIRHSLSHLMSMAIEELYPKTGLGVGPPIEDGFYQDYGLPEGAVISDEIFPKLEKRIKELIKQKIDFVQHEMSFVDALKFYKHDPYKTEMINGLKEAGEKDVSFYKSDWFDNLCQGPHVGNTSEINPMAFKLTKIAGAYWRGDEKNKMLTRIYGVAFASEKDLVAYLNLLAEAKKRDHRKLGKDLDLFIQSDLVGKGLPLWTKYGAAVRRELESFIIEEELKRGYQHVITPELAKVDLYRKSGHYPYYKNTMYPTMKIDDEELILRPMTCPHHFMLYLDKKHSYRELPMRIAELARLFRYEKSGELTGMMRVRSFCLADSHIVCAEEQAKDELMGVIDLIEFVTQSLGLEKGQDLSYRLSLGDRENKEKYYDNDIAWDKAENVLRQTLQELKAPFVEAADEAAFYGPKIDVQMKNVLGKEDTAFTVQYDFCMPDRFDLKYTDKNGEEKRPIVIHRSSIGAIERTFAFLLERYVGAFPTWLAPVQIQIVPVSIKHVEGAGRLARELLVEHRLRVEIDEADETVGNKVRKSVERKIPYIIVVGDKELAGKPWSVRVRGQKDHVRMSKEEFVEKIKKEIKEREIKLI